MPMFGYFVLIVLGFFVAMQWWTKRKAQRVVGQPLPEVDSAVAEALDRRGKAVLYFFSPSCGPCRPMTTVVDRLAQEHDNVFKFDVSRDPDAARAFQVMATPTIVSVSRNGIDAVHLGAMTDKALRQLLRAGGA
jgi:thioredoxin 1